MTGSRHSTRVDHGGFVSHPLWARVEPVVTGLGNDPLYRASGAAVELFHSNVLAWLVRTHPEAAAPLADLFGFPVAEEYRIRREWRHLDLVVDSDDVGHGLVLENKVIALPDAGQLERYHRGVLALEPSRDGRSEFVLLSLLPPVERLPRPWRRVGYGELAHAVDRVCDLMPAGFDADFARRYARLARLLAHLVEAAGAMAHEEESYFLDEATQDRLRDAGVRDLVLKVRNVDLVQAVVAISFQSDGAWHEAGWSNGQPLASRFSAGCPVPGLGTTHLGWQMQGRQLRIVALLRDPALHGTGKERAKAREAAADAYLQRWFDTDKLDAVLPGRVAAYTGSKPYNHFAPDFVYRYGKLADDVAPGELVNGLANLTHLAEAQLAELTTPEH